MDLECSSMREILAFPLRASDLKVRNAQDDKVTEKDNEYKDFSKQ